MATSSPISAADTQSQIAGLRAAFAGIMVPTVARYAELVGLGMVGPLQRELNAVAQANAWQFRYTSAGLADTQVFETTAAAVRAYRILARRLINHMSIVIGVRLAKSVVHDAVQKLEPAQRQLITDYNLVPDTALFGPHH
jgi:hypothetical protein